MRKNNMPFIAFLSENTPLERNTKLIFPISLGQKYHTGERLKALIELAKKYNSTILIADALHRHNLQDEKKALALGDKFLEKNAEIFKETVLIDSVDVWEKYKNDETVIKLVRWRMWGRIKANELKETTELIKQICLQTDSSLIETMNETAHHNLSKFTLTSSIEYQKEENAYLLTFSEFDYHCYPAPLNPSQAETYRLFSQQFKMPIHKSIKFDLIPSSMEIQANKHQRHAQSLPIALRLLTDNIETILKSTEISEGHKRLFITRVNSIFMSVEHECGTNNRNLQEICSTSDNSYQSIENSLSLFFATSRSDLVETKKDSSYIPPSSLTNIQ